MTEARSNPKASLAILNKLQVLIPILLLIGCDGTRGDESLVALGGSLLLAIVLTIFEARPWRPAAVAASCGLATVVICVTELFAFEAMKVLVGPLGAIWSAEDRGSFGDSARSCWRIGIVGRRAVW
jgi:hypothetical protein